MADIRPTEAGAGDQFPPRQPWELYALVGLTIVSSVLVLSDAPSEATPWLVVLMALGIGQALLMPATLSVPIGGGVLAAWMYVAWMLDLWRVDRQVMGVAQMAAVGVSIAMAVRFRRMWQQQQDDLSRYHDLRQRILQEGVGAGLCTRGMAELRALAELDRARAEQRPLGAILVEISAAGQGSRDTLLVDEAFRQAARALADSVGEHDVPFHDREHSLGVILAGRSWEDLCRAVESVQRSVREAPVSGADGVPRRVTECARVHFGLGVYRGGSGEVDLLGAAEDSLQISREMGGLMGLSNGQSGHDPGR